MSAWLDAVYVPHRREFAKYVENVLPPLTNSHRKVGAGSNLGMGLNMLWQRVAMQARFTLKENVGISFFTQILFLQILNSYLQSN